MHRSAPLSKMASTHSGMRRILKRRPPVPVYIRQAVEAGTLRPSPDQDGRRNQQGFNRRNPPVEPYPKDYEILSLNPPIAPPARLPLKLRKERRKVVLPTDRLVRSYLRRHDERVRATHPPTEAQVEEERYAKLLGLPAVPGTDYAMGRKSPVLANAYNFALKQYEVLRSDEAQGGTMTEEESVDVVEKLLAEEAAVERRRSRERADAAGLWREARDGKIESAEEGEDRSAGGSSTGSGRKPSMVEEHDDDIGSKASEAKASASAAAAAASTIPSILTGKPRTIRAMSIWSRRLQAVPYSQWTVGAAAALDHWIAVDVLGLSEDTWDKLLAGDDGEDDEVMTGRGDGGLGIGVGSSARARDVVAVRTALFPETVLFGGPDGDGVDVLGLKEEEEDDDGVDEAQRSIDELLQSLTGFDKEEEEEDEWKLDSKNEKGAASGDGDDLDGRIADMVDTLQEWRAKQRETPYEEWNEDDRSEFDEWLAEYIELLTTDTDGPVDKTATRKALLSEPPMGRDEAAEFWSSVRDETQAEIFLASLRAKGAPERKEGETPQEKAAREASETFLHLPYDKQLRKLVDLGTLRPLFDEYTPESERVAFLERHAETLLEGTEVEHLVPDPNGPISSDDLGDDPTLVDESDRSKKFRIEMIKYGTDEFGTARSERARMLFRAWNEHKAGRARYEEAMFKKGKIGLKK